MTTDAWHQDPDGLWRWGNDATAYSEPPRPDGAGGWRQPVPAAVQPSQGGAAARLGAVTAGAKNLAAQAALRRQERAAADSAAQAGSGVIFQAKSHDEGRNATVTLYGDRIERVLDRSRTSLSRAKQDAEVTPLRAISSVQAKKDGFLYTKVTAYASGNNIEFRFAHDDAHRFRALLTDLVLQRDRPAQPSTPPTAAPLAAPAAPATAPVPDVIEQLTRLAALRDQGILTDEEFSAQKAKLLG